MSPKKEKSGKESKAMKEESQGEMKTMKKESIKEGFLEKKGVIRHNWLKRFFVLEKGDKYPVMKYFKTEKDVAIGKAKGEILLVNATLYAHVEKKGVEMPNYFNIRVGNRDFLIRAKDSTEKAEWVKTIKSNIVKDEEGPNSPNAAKVKKANSFLGVVKENK